MDPEQQSVVRWRWPPVVRIVGARALVVAVTTLVLLSCAGEAGGGRVLAAFQLNAKSHFIMYEPLLKELARRGHRVTVISHFPQKTPLPNYRDISLQGTLPEMVNNVTFDVVERFDVAVLVRLFWQFNVEACEIAFSAPAVKALLASDERFDLVVTEIFSVDCMAALAYRFNAPLVSLQSSVAMHWAWDRMGNPDNPAYMPSYFGQYTARMRLRERLENAALGLAYRAGHWFFERRVDALCRRHVGAAMPPLGALLRNTSLLLVNSHFSLNHATPLVPGVVEVAGMHLREPKPLPPDLLAFVEGAGEDGVVVFSLGSMMRSETMPPALLQALLAAFRALPQRVVWKAGQSAPPGLEASKFFHAYWLPQNDLLHHPRVRAFVTHGGLLGVLEAVAAGVPMVGLPLHSDQFANMRACVRHGVARVLDHKTLRSDQLLEALRAVMQDARYRDNAKKLSKMFLDRPQKPLETAVWWTEYVMRHKGAPQLRSASVHLCWYQLLLLDVVALLVAAAVLIAVIIWMASGAVLRCLLGIGKKSSDLEKEKEKTS